MGFKLYELDEMIANFEFKVDEETGEILNIDELDELQMEREQKIENIGIYIKSLKAEAKALKEEIDNLTVRLKRINNKMESLLNFMKHALGGKNFSTPKVDAKFRTTKATRIVDEDLIPDIYINMKIERAPRKKEILADLKKGVEIPGVELEERTSLTVN